MIKSLKKNDIRTTPFTAAKKWNPQNKLHKDLILWQSGSVSGSLSLTFKEYNDGTVAPYTYISSAIALQQQQDDFLRFREGVNLTGSISPTGSFYYDPVLSEKNVDGTYKTVLYATTKHLFYKESQDPSKIFGLESLDSSNVNRSLPNKISTFNIPQNKFGEKVIPKSVVIKHEIQGQTYSVVDDGNSNLVVSDKTFINNQDANIDKVAANITLNILSGTYDYDGDPYEITATTKPTNLSYIVTYNGSTTPPTNAGTYTVVATINDNFYQGSITGTFTIEQLSTTITLSNLTQTYDGNPKPVTVSIPLTNINYTVTYNGSTTPPTDVGTYNVVVTINDPNYQGTKTATLTVAPQTLSITTQCPSKTYGDDDFTIPVNSVSNGAISYTINSGPATIVNGKIHITGVGTLDVTVNQAASGNYSVTSVNCSSITISPKLLTVTGITAADKVYNGDITATLNTSNAALQGVVTYPNGTRDNVTLNVGSALGEFSSDSVGEGKTVTVSGLTISGTDASKYTLVQPTTTAAIKSSGASGTITMNSATVIYNGELQSLDVIVDSNIPIKITYKNNNNVITIVTLYGGIRTVTEGQYPKDIGRYDVTAELDTEVSTTTKYTVSPVSATLTITSIQGNITFGPDIFYYDRNPKPVITLSQSPVGEDLTITYNGSSTVPSAVGVYEVNVKFKNPNVYYNNTVTLIIKQIPTNNCGTNITNETTYQQNQKNIIDLGSTVGTSTFNFGVTKGTSRFTIEYPLNSGNFVYDSSFRSSTKSIGEKIVDYVETNKVFTVDGNGTATFSFFKNGTGTVNGTDSDKCLVTVYSPENNNQWYYSVSCINQNPTIPDLANFTFDKKYTFTSNNPWILIERPIIELIGLSTLDEDIIVYEYNSKSDNKITGFEATAISRIIKNNIGNQTKAISELTSFILYDDVSNIKIIVSGIKNSDGSVTVGLKYQRVSDSLSDKIISAPLVFDCHFYEYTQDTGTLDFEKAKNALWQQINSDKFENTFISLNNNITDGEEQRSLLRFVAANLKHENFYGIYTLPSGIGNSELQKKTETTDAVGILSDVLIYTNLDTKKVMIVYPAICQTVNLNFVMTK
jgi:hypothetical protein